MPSLYSLSTPLHLTCPTQPHRYADELRRKLKRKRFPQWSHLYWAHHVTHSLVPSGVQLRFLLHHEVGFSRSATT